MKTIRSAPDAILAEMNQRLFDSVLDGVLMLDTKGCIMNLNPAWCRRLGYTLDELIGMPISQLDPPEYASRVPERLKLIATQGYALFETAHTHKDGTVIPVEINSRVVEIDGSKFYLSIVRDITERKQMEAALLEKESQYRVAIETLPDGFWMVDMRGRLLEVNDAYTRLSGFGRDELLSMSISDLEAQERPEETAAHIEAVGRDGYARFESLHRRKDGSIWPVQIVTSYSPVGGGRLFVFSTDLTERQKAEESQQLAAMVYENSSEAILITDAENRIIAVNPFFESMTGYTIDEVRGHNPRLFQSGKHDRAFYQAMWNELNTTGHWHGEIWDKRKNGEELIKLMTINTIKDQAGVVFRYVALFSDITEKKKIEALVWNQANFDLLTKLPNRRMFQDRLEQEAKKSHRAGLPMALMLIDLDRFKEINDTLGHDMGDQLLIDAARRICECVRESDTVSRLGGDEFTVILSELDDLHSVERIAQEIIKRLSEPFKLDMEYAYISASIGISLYPNDATELKALFKHVDQAMYVAKNAGRNRFSYFTSAMQQEAQRRLRLTNDLRAALEKEQFLVYYQPIVDLADGSIYKAEALLRWQHPERGMISPMDFIPLAEESGLIVPIGDWVFRQAAQQVKQWRSKYRESFQISVNKSPVQFHSDARCSNQWMDFLQQLELPEKCLVIEITESLLLNAESSIRKKLLRFRDAGIQVALDDFGTGYSALSYLKKFHIDYLKIDQSFVCNMESDANDIALCEAIIVMAHKLGIRVVAEGVETKAQHDLLVAAGCDYAQGYLFSRPVPADQFERMLENLACAVTRDSRSRYFSECSAA